MKVLLLDAPEHYFILPEHDIFPQLITGKQTPDFIHLFAKNIAAFEKAMQKIYCMLKKYCGYNLGMVV
jgi:hypothetical protein